jgi:ribosome-associated protein
VDVRALRVNHLTSATSFFVNMNGRSKAQIAAIVKNVEDEMAAQFGRTAHRQGKAVSGWVCLDYDDVVVNVFSDAQRQFYGIEKFWAAAQPLDLSDVLTPDGPEAAEEVVSGDVDVDDWELGDDDDWSLDDDDWGLGGDDDEAGVTGTAAIIQEQGGLGLSGPAASDGLFGEFAGEMRVEAVAPEVSLASSEDEEAADAALQALDDGDGADADWALGDDELRELVQRAESGSAMAGSGGGASAEGADDGPASRWQEMMEADGWDEDSLAEELGGAAGGDDEGEADLERFT